MKKRFEMVKNLRQWEKVSEGKFSFPLSQDFQTVHKAIQNRINSTSSNPLVSTKADSDLPYMKQRLNIIEDTDVKNFIVCNRVPWEQILEELKRNYEPRQRAFEYFRNKLNGVHHWYEHSMSEDQEARRLEENLFDNVMFNLFFCWGLDLKSSLLDVEKIFEIVETLTNGERGRDLISPPPPSTLTEQEKWKKVIDFMRKNPKVLFGALPDEDPVGYGVAMFEKEEDM